MQFSCSTSGMTEGTMTLAQKMTVGKGSLTAGENCRLGRGRHRSVYLAKLLVSPGLPPPLLPLVTLEVGRRNIPTERLRIYTG